MASLQETLFSSDEEAEEVISDDEGGEDDGINKDFEFGGILVCWC